MNLYYETVSFLTKQGKSIDDVVFVSGNGHEIPMDNFVAIAKAYNYDEGYGTNEVPTDLLVVGKDWWIERYEYDGSEWWEFKTLPARPSAVRKVSGFNEWGEYVYDKGGEK